MQIAFALALAALAFIGGYAYETSTLQRPNILFILADDQGDQQWSPRFCLMDL